MSKTNRDGWPDLAKGLCIILVVLWHVVTKHVQHIDWGSGESAASLWGVVSAQLLPLRMPLFFLISGVFAASIVYANNYERIVRRSGGLLALYVVWVLIQTVLFAWIAPEFETARAHSVSELFAHLTYSPTNLWYLQALALYLLLARATRRLPPVVVLGCAFVISSAAAAGALPTWGNFWQVAQNGVFFLLGLYGRQRIRDAAATITGKWAIGLCALFGVGLILVGALDARNILGVWPTVSALAVAAGVSVCVLGDRHASGVTQPLRWLGQRTLPIYVLHMIPLAIIHNVVADHNAIIRLPGAVVWEPLVVTVLVVAVSIGLYYALRYLRLGRLFRPDIPYRSKHSIAPTQTS
ncbi:acyltransferase family protein [Jonesia quinghaiensis]|uniref:acyltransferase family protein n=1 Tax=Jonesia quinghaiensis TaxID=262806 RepID=UPI000424CD9C|nr:acyltransferase family protein [Jonesia quinghaiensis]